MEVSVVVVILLLMATAVTPSLMNQRHSQEFQSFLSGMRDAALLGRDRAITSGSTLVMTYDDSQRQLTLKVEEAPTTNTTANPTGITSLKTAAANALASNNDAGEQIVKQISLPPDVNVTSYRLGDQDSTSAEWQLHFYPDGKTDGGGIEIDSNGAAYSLIVGTNGGAQVSREKYPAPTTESWAAGDYEKRL